MQIKRLVVEFSGDWSSYIVRDENGEAYVVSKRSVVYPATRKTMREILKEAGYDYDTLIKLEQARLTEEFLSNLPSREQLIKELAVSPTFSYVDLANPDVEEDSVVREEVVDIALKPVSIFVPKVWSLTEFIFNDSEQLIELDEQTVEAVVLEHVNSYGYRALKDGHYRVITSIHRVSEGEVNADELTVSGTLHKMPPISLIISYLRAADWHTISVSGKVLSRWIIEHGIEDLKEYADRIYLEFGDSTISLKELTKAPEVLGKLEIGKELPELKQLIVENIAEVVA